MLQLTLLQQLLCTMVQHQSLVAGLHRLPTFLILILLAVDGLGSIACSSARLDLNLQGVVGAAERPAGRQQENRPLASSSANILGRCNSSTYAVDSSGHHTMSIAVQMWQLRRKSLLHAATIQGVEHSPSLCLNAEICRIGWCHHSVVGAMRENDITAEAKVDLDRQVANSKVVLAHYRGFTVAAVVVEGTQVGKRQRHEDICDVCAVDCLKA
jgi:hypothetical protein